MSTLGDIGKFILSPAGSLIGNMPSKEELADRWIRENLPNRAEYSATLTTLSSDITKWTNLCGDYVHQRNPLYNRANGRSICQGKIELIYQDQLGFLKAEEKRDIERFKNGGGISSKMISLIVVAIIIMVVIVIIIKM